MDPLVVVLTVVATVLSLVLVVVGVQTVLVLQEVRRSLKRFNTMTEVIEATVTKTLSPLQHLGSLTQGLKVGFKMVDSFANYLQSKAQDEKSGK